MKSIQELHPASLLAGLEGEGEDLVVVLEDSRGAAVDLVGAAFQGNGKWQW